MELNGISTNLQNYSKLQPEYEFSFTVYPSVVGLLQTTLSLVQPLRTSDSPETHNLTLQNACVQDTRLEAQ